MAGNLNRALLVHENWEAQERELRTLPELGMNNRDLLLAKYDFLSKGIARVEIDPSAREKLALGVLRGVVNKLEKELYPNVLLRTARSLKTALLDKPRYLRSFLKFRDQNIREVGAMLEARGMGQHFGKLENYLDFERSEVELSMKTNLSETVSLSMSAQLYKNKSGGYELEAIEAGIKHEGEPEKDRKFMFEAKYHVEALKMLNLLMGRSVLNGPNELNHFATNQWLQLGERNGSYYSEMRVFQPEQGFDLKAVLNDFAAQTGFYRATAPDVVLQLSWGQQVSISGKHPKDEPICLEASPGTGGLILRDRNQQVIGIEQVLAGSHLHRMGQEDQLKVELHTISENNRQDQSRGIGS